MPGSSSADRLLRSARGAGRPGRPGRGRRGLGRCLAVGVGCVRGVRLRHRRRLVRAGRRRPAPGQPAAHEEDDPLRQADAQQQDAQDGRATHGQGNAAAALTPARAASVHVVATAWQALLGACVPACSKSSPGPGTSAQPMQHAEPNAAQSSMRQDLTDVPALAKLPPQALAALEAAQFRADVNNKKVDVSRSPLAAAAVPACPAAKLLCSASRARSAAHHPRTCVPAVPVRPHRTHTWGTTVVYCADEDEAGQDRGQDGAQALAHHHRHPSRCCPGALLLPGVQGLAGSWPHTGAQRGHRE